MLGAALNEICVHGQDSCDKPHAPGPGIIRSAAICLKPLPGQSASTREYPLRSTSWVARQAGH